MAAAALTRSVTPAAASTASSSRVCTARPSSVSLAKAFGLRSCSMGRVTCMAVYKVTLKTPQGDHVVDFDSDTDPESYFILDAAEDAGVEELPYSCRAGACSSCTGLVEAGAVNQDGQSFLDDDQVANGFVLTCIARPTGDCTIATHREEDLA